MLRLSFVMILVANGLNAATIDFDDKHGTWIDADYGGKQDVYDIYRNELEENQRNFAACKAGGILGTDPADCGSLLEFNDARAIGYFKDFESYYAAHFQRAVESYDIVGWETDRISVFSSNYVFFAGGIRRSRLGIVRTLNSESIAPSLIEIVLKDDALLSSIDLAMGVPGYSNGILIEGGGYQLEIGSEFNGTFEFPDYFKDVRRFTMRAGVSMYDGIFGFSYGNLVLEEPAPVSLPASLLGSAMGILALVFFRRRQNSVSRAGKAPPCCQG